MLNAMQVPVVKHVPAIEVEAVERKLRESAYQKRNGQPARAVEHAFRNLDADGFGGVTLDQFVSALERFGLHVDGNRRGHGGLRPEVVQALFDKYDVTGSGSISYADFVRALFAEERARAVQSASAGPGPAAMEASRPPPRRSKPCYEENAWLKGSNGIFG